MIFDFSFEQIMKLSNIKRWGVVEMSRPQSVAEHSYNVAMISAMIVDKLPDEVNPVGLRETVINWSLVHDLPELVTGDIPTPIKKLIKPSLDDAGRGLFPKITAHEKSMCEMAIAVCKMADLIDAIQFANKFCVDSGRKEIIDGMKWELDEVPAGVSDTDAAISLHRVVREIWTEEKTL